MRKRLCTLSVALFLVTACDDDDKQDDTMRDAGMSVDGGAPTSDGGTLTDVIARGRYLVENVAVCGDCHTPRKADGSPDVSRTLGGADCFLDSAPADSNTGCLATPNLSNHETGLKNRSAQEIKDMFMKGVRPDGKGLQPVMPYYVLGNMRAADADAIVAYLRTVAPVDHMVAPSQSPFLPLEAPVPVLSEALIPSPSPSYADRDAALRGRYLAGDIGICMECHTPRDDEQHLVTSKLFQGGNVFRAADLGLPPTFPMRIYSSNLTPHSTGIAGYSVDDIVRAIKQGVDKNQGGVHLCPPMPAGPMGAFAGITDDDARDIAHYLLSLAPADNPIPEDCQIPSAPTASVPGDR